MSFECINNTFMVLCSLLFSMYLRLSLIEGRKRKPTPIQLAIITLTVGRVEGGCSRHSIYLLVPLRFNRYAERPQPPSVQGATVPEGGAPELGAVALVPGGAQFAPVRGQKDLRLGQVRVDGVDFVPKLNDGQGQPRGGNGHRK